MCMRKLHFGKGFEGKLREILEYNLESHYFEVDVSDYLVEAQRLVRKTILKLLGITEEGLDEIFQEEYKAYWEHYKVEATKYFKSQGIKIKGFTD